MMKLIIAILRDTDEENVSNALIAADIRVTRIASTGGYFRRGSSTLLVGVDDDRLESALQIIRASIAPAIEPGLHRGTLFVLPVEQFEQI